MRLLNFVLLTAIAATACSRESTTALDLESADRFVGIIEVVETRDLQPAGGFNAAPLTAPDTVTAGLPFQATVTTVGLSSCWQAAGAAVQAEPRRVVITPYDRIDGSGMCTGALVSLPRTIDVVFTQRGEAVLRLEGRRAYEVNASSTSALAVEKRIHVR